jgi:hypothetical protein
MHLVFFVLVYSNVVRIGALWFAFQYEVIMTVSGQDANNSLGKLPRD